MYYFQFALHNNTRYIRLVWIPSYFGIVAKNMMDLLEKFAYHIFNGTSHSLCCYKTIIHPSLSSLHTTAWTLSLLRMYLQQYDIFPPFPPKYRRHWLIVRWNNIGSAWFRLEYRPVWQVSKRSDISHFPCKLGGYSNANNLLHHYFECLSVREMLLVCSFHLASKVILVWNLHFGVCWSLIYEIALQIIHQTNHPSINFVN